MMSILQKDDACYICQCPYVEEHHIFYGNANRRLSEKYGCKVWLCYEHHRGNGGVHFNHKLDLRLKQECQEAFEATFDLDFRQIFGKNYK